MQIETQPPSTITVGEIFTVIVKVNLNNNNVIPSYLVSVNITQDIDPNLPSYLLQTYINLLGQSRNDFTTYNSRV